MKIVFWGTPDFAVPTLQQLLAEPEFQVLGVVTQPDKRRGRGNQLIPSPVKQVALEAQLPVWQPARVKKDPQTLAALAELAADVFVVVAYGQILSPEILAMPRLGCINNHGSLLPAYRGAAPIQWALYNGETTTGITTMLMDAGMDTGAMLLKASLEVTPQDNAETLGQQLAHLGAELMLKTLRALELGELQPHPQDESLATYAPLIRKPDYGLDWSRPALAIHNQVRGFYPNCQTSLREQPLKILATLPVAQADLPKPPSPQPPGSVLQLLKNQGPVIRTGEGVLLLLQVQAPGKKVQSGWDFANGMRLQVGEQLG
jgi:methionyl-tRNA formyltransferase